MASIGVTEIMTDRQDTINEDVVEEVEIEDVDVVVVLDIDKITNIQIILRSILLDK